MSRWIVVDETGENGGDVAPFVLFDVDKHEYLVDDLNCPLEFDTFNEAANYRDSYIMAQEDNIASVDEMVTKVTKITEKMNRKSKIMFQASRTRDALMKGKFENVTIEFNVSGGGHKVSFSNYTEGEIDPMAMENLSRFLVNALSDRIQKEKAEIDELAAMI